MRRGRRCCDAASCQVQCWGRQLVKPIIEGCGILANTARCALHQGSVERGQPGMEGAHPAAGFLSDLVVGIHAQDPQ